MMPFIYCYDAYCGWCYGFSPVIKRIAEEYQNRFFFEVLSGGMILSDPPRHISAMAGYIQEAHKVVEDHTGIKFGEDFLWHINHPDKSDWFPDSTKPAIALAIFKEYHPNQQVFFAADLQYALNYEGRDLCDDEAYRHLLGKYNIPAEEFYAKLKDEGFKEKAQQEFALCKQLKVTGFPTAFLQVSESKVYMVARGFTSYDELKERIEKILLEVNPAPHPHL